MKNTLFCLLLLLSFKASSQIPSNGLIRQFSFTNNFNDNINNENGESVGVVFAQDRNGVANNAASFDGSSIVKIGNAPDLNFTDFSFSFWVNPNDLNGTKILLAKHNSWQFKNNSSGNYELFLASPSKSFFLTGSYIPLNTWTHVTVIKTTSQVSFYINGIAVSIQNLASHEPVVNTIELAIGGKGTTSLFRFKGEMDEVLFFDRELSTSEASDIYNSYFSQCADGIQNGNETGIDCGGDCDPCPPTCTDGIQNGDETGVDCGGSSCDPCSTTDTTEITIVESHWDTIGSTLFPKNIDLNIGIGTQVANDKLSVLGNVGIDGNVRAIEYTATPDVWPDYVFDSNYDMLTLAEIKRFISQNHHLPNIPSEEKVMKDGIGLAEMNVLLLEKVEELTLHLIELNEKIEKLEQRLEVGN